MIRSLKWLSALLLCAALTGRAAANAPPDPPQLPAATDPAIPPPGADTPTNVSNSEPGGLAGPTAIALRAKLSALPTEGSAAEITERHALSDFYAARADAPLWATDKGLTAKGAAVVAEIKDAGSWGLDAKDFPLPKLGPEDASAADLTADAVADAELTLSLAVLKYARYARGGRIIDPTILLSSELDRKPQLIEPRTVLDGIAAAEEPAVYLRGLNPKQPQFEKLRQALLKTRNGPQAKRLIANMEEWRWMPDDMGELYVIANIPEFMMRLVKKDETIHTERIVAGEIGKQTTIFTRPLKTIVFKPMWRVPESIKVRELWPNLRRGGSMFRQYDLELQTKDGQPLDYHSIDWSTADIRNYEVVQPPGRKNVMGVVKFTFPSQHTIFMHDTVDKWMFNATQRTLSHGCLRLRNPMKLAELVLAEDKGWDAAHVQEMLDTGPRNNEIVIERKIPINLVYFTAWVDDSGTLRTFNDVYGHEKRIRLALEGKWDQIDIGRDHLAAVEPEEANLSAGGPPARLRRKEETIIDIVGSALGGEF